MITELCPDGVRWHPIASVARRNKGVSITAAQMKRIHTPGGPIKVFAAGHTVANAELHALPPGTVTTDPSVIVKSRGHIGFEYCEKPFTHKNELWSYTFSPETVHPKFAYYYLLTRTSALQGLAAATSVKLPQLSVAQTDQLRIPVPPLTVQREVVRVLDMFTELEAELDAELEAELEARRRQYEYYRKHLVSGNLGALGIDEVSLGELFEMRAGAHIASPKIHEQPDAEHPFECFGGNGIRGYVGDFSHDGDYVLVGRQGALCGNVKRVSGKFYATEHAVVLTPRDGVNPDWAFHALAEAELNQYASKSAQPGLAVGKLKTVKIKTPAEADQNTIATQLNLFDTLVTDLTSGLPAEIAARRKQYEYYRDKLLTFDEVAT